MSNAQGAGDRRDRRRCIHDGDECVTTRPQVSVIIPCYNQAALLPEALSSIVAQTMGHWEAIIVDDGSTDPEVVAVARRWASRDDRIRFVRQQNGGLSA